MERTRTIFEAIKLVLKNAPKGMTYKQIYQKIVEEGLYEFGAKSPESVVRNEIRRHCVDTDFPSSSPVKAFKIDHEENRQCYYVLLPEEAGVVTPLEGTKKKEAIKYVMDIEDELLPEEKMVQAYNHYLRDLKCSLITKVRECHPSFFEKMVVDLLLSMGYGYDENSGKVTRNSHDGGIDGIISEDKLGLNLIYIQAKRYNEGNSVGRPEVQRFIGAMQRAEKGVFITTSWFTNEAISFANAETRKHIKLIDGETLVDLMIKHSVGLEKIKEYVVYKVNEDYFSDNM